MLPDHRAPRRSVFITLLALPLLLGGLLDTARAEDEDVPLDEFFRGRVIALDGKTVTLRYDFSKEAQMTDWAERVPFPLKRITGQHIRWFDERLEVQGNTGARHIAEWKGDVEVRCRVTLDTDKDVGGYLVPSGDTKDYAAFALGETYFHAWDNSAGGNNSILKFGKQWRESGSTSDFVGFRYIVRRPPREPLAPGRTLDMSFGLARGKLFMKFPDFDMSGKDMGKRLKVHRPGLYTINGRALFDDVTITGRLDPKWMKTHSIALRTVRPIVDDGSLDEETRTLLASYEAGTTDASELVSLVSDASLANSARAAVATALGAGPRRAVRATIDLLYSPDEATRTHGIAIVKALLGKDYGYKPRAKEPSRQAAIRKLNKDLKDHPELLDG